MTSVTAGRHLHRQRQCQRRSQHQRWRLKENIIWRPQAFLRLSIANAIATSFAGNHPETNSFVCQSIFCRMLHAKAELCKRQVGPAGGQGSIGNSTSYNGREVTVANDVERLQKCHRSSWVPKEGSRCSQTGKGLLCPCSRDYISKISIRCWAWLQRTRNPCLYCG